MKIFFFIIVLFLLFSCTKNYREGKPNAVSSKQLSQKEIANRSALILDPIDYVRWVNEKENNLVFQKSIDNIQFSILFKPIDYIICKELRKDQISEAEYENIKSQLGDLQYFDLRVKVNGFNEEFLKYNLSSSSDYDRKVNYCAFQMQSDIKIVEGLDTIPCSLFHFERAFDVVPYGEFILGFEKSNRPAKEKTFILYDKIFNKGIVKFTFDVSNITHLPKLRTI